MLRYALQSMFARKMRLVSTALAVMIGVAFLAGSLVLIDTIGKTFDNLFSDVNENTDAYVRSSAVIDAEWGAEVRGRIDDSLLDDVQAVDGVQAAALDVSGYAQLVDRDGEAIGNPGNGPPTIGWGWITVPELNPMRLLPGSRAPERAGEVVIDKATADDAGFGVGDTVTVLLKGPPQQVEIVGIARFGDADSVLGATLTFFDTATAQSVLGEPGRASGISVLAAPGVSQQEVRDRIAAAVGTEGIEVITGDALTEEQQDQVADALSFFNTFMLVFAGVALFVGAFIIYNTFSIIVAQRVRELALLRAVGASRRQVLGSVQLEAAVVGLLASVIGITAGLGVAAGLKALLASFGFEIPTTGLVFRTRTAVVTLIVGLGVTSVSAVAPAIKASSIAPLAAMRTAAVDRSARSRWRAAIGAMLAATGVGGVLLGLFGSVSNRAAIVGVGATGLFLGVAVLGPVLVAPMCGTLGWLVERTRGVPGELARENAVRNPRRTSASAAALMIGVGLVGFITIFAASAKASIDKIVDDSFIGDLVVDSGMYGFGGLSPDLAERLNELPEVEAASGVRVGYAEIAGRSRVLYGVDPSTIGEIVDVGVIAGRLEDLDAGSIAVHDDEARQRGWKLGDVITVRFAETGEQQLTLRVLYTERQLAGDYVLGYAGYEANFADVYDFQVYIRRAAGVTPEAARAAVEAVAADYANAEVQDLSEFKDAQAAQINQLLGLVYALLFLSVLIALIGIANTLFLSIIERRQELGLLRAVGMSRRQLRSAVRWESVLVAMMGALLGVVIGVFFGWAVMRALADEGFSVLQVPSLQIAIIVVAAAFVGVVASVRPARRAAKLDVLRAINAR